MTALFCVVVTTDDYAPDLVTHIFTPARTVVDRQANHLQLRNVVSNAHASAVTHSSTGFSTQPLSSPNSDLASDSEMAAPSMQEYTISVYDSDPHNVTFSQNIHVEVLTTTPITLPQVPIMPSTVPGTTLETTSIMKIKI